jgi:hypothetical protein
LNLESNPTVLLNPKTNLNSENKGNRLHILKNLKILFFKHGEKKLFASNFFSGFGIWIYKPQ